MHAWCAKIRNKCFNLKLCNPHLGLSVSGLWESPEALLRGCWAAQKLTLDICHLSGSARSSPMLIFLSIRSATARKARFSDPSRACQASQPSNTKRNLPK